MNSEVLNSERFGRLLNESEESVHKLIADIARKFYKLGLEDGIQAALLSGVKTVSPPPKRANYLMNYILDYRATHIFVIIMSFIYGLIRCINYTCRSIRFS